MELTEAVIRLEENGIDIHAMRDITRGGLATILDEFAAGSGCSICINEKDIPVSAETRDLCGLLGLDPLYMGNEGKAVIIVREEDADMALELLVKSRYTSGAVAVGKVTDGRSDPHVTLQTGIGGLRRVGRLTGEGLPRVC